MTANIEDKQRIQADPRLRHAYPYFRMHLEEIRACIECGCSMRSVWRAYATRAAHPFPGSYSSFLRYCDAHALGRRRAKEGTQSDLHRRGQALPAQRPNETPSKRGPLRGPKPVGSVLGPLKKVYPPPRGRPPGLTPEQIDRMMDPDRDLEPNR
jgi:hypothetical protein